MDSLGVFRCLECEAVGLLVKDATGHCIYCAGRNLVKHSHYEEKADMSAICPWCKQDCSGTAEYVDIGVGAQQVSAHACDNCFSVEIGPFDDGPYAWEEWANGWTFPDEYDRYASAERVSAEEYLRRRRTSVSQ